MKYVEQIINNTPRDSSLEKPWHVLVDLSIAHPIPFSLGIAHPISFPLAFLSRLALLVSLALLAPLALFTLCGLTFLALAGFLGGFFAPRRCSGRYSERCSWRQGGR